MSFLHPTADLNSAGENPDPLTTVRRRRARDANFEALRTRDPTQPLRDFLNWDVISNDVLVLKPFDSLPTDAQDRIRERRQRQFRESAVPWIVNDATALLTVYDDVDDLIKAARFAKLYGFDPAAALAGKGPAGLRDWFSKERDIFFQTCDDGLSPRGRKLAFGRVPRFDLLSLAGLLALAKLFPQWRAVILGVQALQALHTLTGVGLQLGPILGVAMETAARALSNLGLPFTPAHNKYHQILAARITGKSARYVAAIQSSTGEDALTVAAGINQASKSDFMPQLTIEPSDYPSVRDVVSSPWQQIGNAAALAASLPYNIAAYIANDLIPGTLRNWSCALTANCPDNPLTGDLRAAAQSLRQMADDGVCPGPFCGAELNMGVNIYEHPYLRRDPETGEPRNRFLTLRHLRWNVPPDLLPQ